MSRVTWDWAILVVGVDAAEMNLEKAKSATFPFKPFYGSTLETPALREMSEHHKIH